MDRITDGNISLNLADGTAEKDGVPLTMTSKEFELLHLLISNKGQTLGKDLIFSRIWGADSESEPQTLTVHIKWLREKIENDPKNPERIITVWGKGYRWEG
jgi:DNA-binding response OmpR family regulator